MKQCPENLSLLRWASCLAVPVTTTTINKGDTSAGGKKKKTPNCNQFRPGHSPGSKHSRGCRRSFVYNMFQQSSLSQWVQHVPAGFTASTGNQGWNNSDWICRQRQGVRVSLLPPPSAQRGIEGRVLLAGRHFPISTPKPHTSVPLQGPYGRWPAPSRYAGWRRGGLAQECGWPTVYKGLTQPKG